MVPRKTKPPSGLLAAISEANEVGADELVVDSLRQMLETGARPAEVAKEVGIDTNRLWMVIHKSPALRKAVSVGDEVRQAETAEAVRMRLGRVVSAMADMVDDPEIPGSARVAAGKEFWSMAKDLGVMKPQGQPQQAGVVAMDGEFKGRLAVLLGTKGGDSDD